MSLGPRGRAGLALLIYLALWIWRPIAFHALVHPTSLAVAPRSPDPAFFVWALRWWPYAIAHGLDPLRPAIIGVPVGRDLTWTAPIPGPSAVLAPISVPFGPVVAFNFLLILSIPVAALCAFLLCSRITRTFLPALAGGYVFGFSPFEIDHTSVGHLNLMLAFLLPLGVYVMVLGWERSISTRTTIVLLSAILAFEFLTSTELFATTAAVAGVTLVLLLVMSPRDVRRRLFGVVRSVLIAYAIALVVVSPLLFAMASDPAPPVGDVPGYASVSPAAMLIPRPFGRENLGFLSKDARATTEPSGDGYLGIPLVVIAVWFFVERRRTVAGRVLPTLLLLLLAAELGPRLGTISLPWGWIWRLPPIDHAFPARLGVYIALVAGVILSMWLSAGGPRWLRWTIAGLAIASLLPYYLILSPPSPRLDPAFAGGNGPSRLTGRDVVLVLPDHNDTAMLWQAESGMRFRLADGFTNYHITRHHGQPRVVSQIESLGPNVALERRFGEFLRRSGVTAVIVNPSVPSPWPEVLTALGLSPQRVGGFDLYRVPTLGLSLP
ncbi:MAG TPA: hypothetical protein VEM41_11455 [Actinomycetota bacterium]|nr:hypothetical protein [Actinomycetota bacterium]